MSVADPFADECPTHGDRCPCRRCHGEHVITVGQEYVDRIRPLPTIEEVQGLDDDATRAFHAHVDERRAALANSVYPCPLCRPAQFHRWEGGHYAKDHDLSSCAECIDILGGRRAARRLARSTNHQPEPRERRDVD